MSHFPVLPVVKGTQGLFNAVALVGLHSVILSWNMDSSIDRSDLLGFAIKRTAFLPDGTALEMRWLKGQKRFKANEYDTGFEVHSYAAPFQRFRWSDYSVSADGDYLYEIFPVTGTPLNLLLLSPIALPVHTYHQNLLPMEIYINRGVTSALAYYERYQDLHPSEVANQAAYHWLSRGLKESLLNFISEAESGDSLNIAIYEFHDEEIAAKLAELIKKGVILQLLYHAGDGTKQTEKTNLSIIQKYDLERCSTKRTNAKLSHNKFAILVKNNFPTKLWTGSANFSEAAFHFQTNFSVILDDPIVLQAYQNYFNLLIQDLTRGRKNKNLEYIQDRIQTILDNLQVSSKVSKTLFSPLRGDDILDAASSLIKSAKSAVFLSTPFAMDGSLIEALNANAERIIEYGLINSTAKKKIEGQNRSNTRFYTPTRLETYLGRRWDAKMFGSHKIHAKTLIIDPWGENPAILFGSANFSRASCRYNDENMLLVQDNKEIVSVFTTEFIRMFDHYKSRWFINNFFSSENAQIRYLEDNGSWSDIYFKQTSRSHKYRDREVFSGLV